MRSSTAGWLGVAAVVVAAEGHAVATNGRMMSESAGRHPWRTGIVGTVLFVHLLMPPRLHHLDPSRRLALALTRWRNR